MNGGGITVSKAYNNSTVITAATDVTFGASALTGGSTGPNDGKYVGTENVTLAVDAAGTFERSLPGTMIPITTTVKLASGNAVNDNYTLRAQPTGLTGEITGSATLDQNGVALNVSTGSFLHVRNTTASRMQDGMTFQTTVGEVLIENSSFDGWMQRATPNTKIDDGGAVTFQFTESAGVLVNSPVLRIKMEANDPNADPWTNQDYMLLGDYELHLRHDPDGTPASGDETSRTLFSFPGGESDPNVPAGFSSNRGYGSLAPSADLVIRDSADSFLNDVPYDTPVYQFEPFVDANSNGVYDSGETFTDLNGNSQYDLGVAFAKPDPSSPYLIEFAPVLGEYRTDGESFTDANGNGLYDSGEPFVDTNADGIRNAAQSEFFTDNNGNGFYDSGELFTDRNGNGVYDAASAGTMADLNISTAAGNWDVTVSDPALGGEGKVTDLRLKYNNNTKVLIEGPDGVRLLNVKFEGMDEVDVRTTDLNNRVLMSATLLTDPNISKMVVKASQTLEAQLNSDATFREVKSMNNAELLAGVRYNSITGNMEFIPGTARTLQIDGPGVGGPANIHIAGQLSLASSTVVFNNANIVSGGVIQVRTGDGAVNRTYGTVVPGTVSFMGGLGNHFHNTGNGISMSIANSSDISGAFSSGKLTDIGSSAPNGTVMNVGKVQ